jgi:hypothetical protein
MWFSQSSLDAGYPSGESESNTLFSVDGRTTGWVACSNLRSRGNIQASGTKSRVVDTDNYGTRLLYCDETPSPTFTDFGSGRTDEDGLCYVEIDGIFAETVRTDMAYQVFLQKCGAGDLWVEEKTPSYFTVHGTPNLAFDWQLKAHQTGFEFDRLEDMDRRDESDAMGVADEGMADSYADELNYVNRIEALYEQEETNEAA